MGVHECIRESKGIVLLANATAGGGRARGVIPRVEGYFRSQGIQFERSEAGSSAELTQRAAQAIERGRELLIAIGGDGTFQAVANAAAGSNVRLGIIPAGGGNDFAAAVGYSPDPIGAAEQILRGPPRAMDLLRARTADGRTRYYAGGGGIGLDAETAPYASGPLRRLPGVFRYGLGLLLALRDFRPLRVTVEFPDGEHATIEDSMLLAAVLNTPTYGAGLRVAPAAAPDDGLLDVVLVGLLGAAELLEVIPALLQTRAVMHPKLRRYQARRVRLSAATTARFHGDGEILGSAPVEIEIARAAIQIVGPAMGKSPA